MGALRFPASDGRTDSLDVFTGEMEVTTHYVQSLLTLYVACRAFLEAWLCFIHM
jgi:hypothetical protein